MNYSPESFSLLSECRSITERMSSILYRSVKVKSRQKTKETRNDRTCQPTVGFVLNLFETSIQRSDKLFLILVIKYRTPEQRTLRKSIEENCDKNKKFVSIFNFRRFVLCCWTKKRNLPFSLKASSAENVVEEAKRIFNEISSLEKPIERRENVGKIFR